MMQRTIFKEIKESFPIQVIFVFAVYIFLIFFCIRPYQYNLSSLVKIDAQDPHYRPEIIPSGTIVFQGYGYDGQYNFYIVKDLIFKGTFTDAFRYQRVLYPALIKFISMGSDKFLPISFILVNLISIFFGMFYLRKLIGKLRMHNLLILYGLNLGFILGTLYDLGTPLAISFIVVSFYFLQQKKLWLTSLSLAFSLLTTENALLVIIPLFFYFIWKKEFRNSIYLLVSFIPWLLWQLILWRQFGIIPILSSAGAITFPFYGIGQQGIDIVKHQYIGIVETLRQTNVIWMMLFVIACLGIGAIKFRIDKELYSILILVHAIFGVCLSQSIIWSHTITSPARVLCGIFPLLILSYSQDKNNKLLQFLIYFAWLLTGIGIIRIFLLPQHPYFIK